MLRRLLASLALATSFAVLPALAAPPELGTGAPLEGRDGSTRPGTIRLVLGKLPMTGASDNPTAMRLTPGHFVLLEISGIDPAKSGWDVEFVGKGATWKEQPKGVQIWGWAEGDTEEKLHPETKTQTLFVASQSAVRDGDKWVPAGGVFVIKALGSNETGKPSVLYRLEVTIGQPATPVAPVVPVPVAPIAPAAPDELDAALAGKLREALQADQATSATAKASALKLAGVYEKAAKSLSAGGGDPNVKAPATWGDLLSKMAKLSDDDKVPVLPELSKTRVVIDVYVGRRDANTELSIELIGSLTKKLRTISASLKEATK